MGRFWKHRKSIEPKDTLSPSADLLAALRALPAHAGASTLAEPAPLATQDASRDDKVTSGPTRP